MLATRVMVTGHGTTRGDWDGNRVVNPVNTSNTTANERGKTKDRFLVLHPLDYSCFGATLDYDILGSHLISGALEVQGLLLECPTIFVRTFLVLGDRRQRSFGSAARNLIEAVADCSQETEILLSP